MKKLKTVDADTLLYQPLEKSSFVVDGLIPTGLTLFCGGAEDWQKLDYAEAVPVRVGGQAPVGAAYRAGKRAVPVFGGYLLPYRIQNRLFRLTDKASERLRFAVASCKLTDRMVGQLEDYQRSVKKQPGY